MPDANDPAAHTPHDLQPHDLRRMTQVLLAFRRERDWEQFHNPKDQFLSLVLEATELLELAQWRQGEALDAHLTEHADEVADELADVLGWVLLIAADRKIDLAEAFDRKMAMNVAKYPADKSRGRATKYDKL
ncbi:MAG: MazG-like family protein [Phycisphaerae bacterium]